VVDLECLSQPRQMMEASIHTPNAIIPGIVPNKTGSWHKWTSGVHPSEPEDVVENQERHKADEQNHSNLLCDEPRPDGGPASGDPFVK